MFSCQEKDEGVRLPWYVKKMNTKQRATLDKILTAYETIVNKIILMYRKSL